MFALKRNKKGITYSKWFLRALIRSTMKETIVRDRGLLTVLQRCMGHLQIMTNLQKTCKNLIHYDFLHIQTVQHPRAKCQKSGHSKFFSMFSVLYCNKK